MTAVQFGLSGQGIFSPGFAYEYGYNAAGRVTMQRMAAMGLYSSTMTFDATYAWDNEGRMSSRTYPSGWWSPGSGVTYALQYDLMGRLSGVTHGGATDASATYGPAGEMTNISYEGYSESRTYNSLLQLTRQTVAGVFDMEYVFPAGANDGRVSSTIDHISGEQVNYSYDALNRLTLAQTVSTAWGQAYTFVGFGNLTAKTVTQGSGSNWAQAYDPATNRAVANSGMTYDANGNTHYTYYGSIGYDAENRITSEGSTSLYYDPSGKRVAEVQPNANTWTLYFYDITGQRIMSLPYPSGQQTYSLYFGGKLVVAVVTDRLGSVRANGNGETFSYLPYGEERTATADGRVKFGTYFRDSSGVAAQDYADQRYYNPWYGRFNSPDRGGIKTATPANPISWNRYAYVNGDPINHTDRRGLCEDQDRECEDDCDDIFCIDDPDPQAGGGGGQDPGHGGGAPSNKGGLSTNPASTLKTARQYLDTIWSDCLADFSKDARCDGYTFGLILQNINWLAPGSASIDSYAHNGDTRPISALVAGGESAATIPGTNYVVVGPDYYTDNTQTEQIAIAVHDALHIMTYSWGAPFQNGGDAALAGWLANFGFDNSHFDPANSHQITDWIVGTADHTSTAGGGCKNP